MCISWKYDSALEFARKLRSRISPEAEVPEKHQVTGILELEKGPSEGS